MSKVLLVVLQGHVTNEKGEFVGVKFAGKDTAALELEYLLAQNELKGYEGAMVHKFAFAKEIKDVLAEVYGFDVQRFNDPLHKEENRRLLEVFGTDVVRQGLPLVIPRLCLRTEDTWADK